MKSSQYKTHKSYDSTEKQSGAVEACWAHNPEVDGSKPFSAMPFFFFFFVVLYCFFFFPCTFVFRDGLLNCGARSNCLVYVQHIPNFVIAPSIKNSRFSTTCVLNCYSFSSYMCKQHKGPKRYIKMPPTVTGRCTMTLCAS